MTARALVSQAKRDGLLVPAPCEECGATPTDAHHDDYAKPLDVRWLCRSCHRRWHGQNEPLNNDEVEFTVRIPRELRDQLNEIAKREDRTQAAEIRRALVAHVEADTAARSA